MDRSLLVRLAVGVLGMGSLALQPLLAQTFAATTGTEGIINVTPARGIGKVSVPGHSKKAEETLLFGRIRDGVYTVDGMVAKVKLNYDVNGVSFLYMFVPGVGTAVVSANAQPDAVVTQAKLRDDDLSFTVGDHRFNLTGVTLASNKGTVPAHLYVRLDREAWKLNRQAMVGFGNVAELPYSWPGALPGATEARAEETEVMPPPVPVSLLPSRKAIVPSTLAEPAAMQTPQLRPVALQ